MGGLACSSGYARPPRTPTSPRSASTSTSLTLTSASSPPAARPPAWAERAASPFFHGALSARATSPFFCGAPSARERTELACGPRAAAAADHAVPRAADDAEPTDGELLRAVRVVDERGVLDAACGASNVYSVI